MKTVKGLLAACALGAAALPSLAQNLTLGHIVPPSHVWHRVSEKIAADLAAESGDKMKIAVVPLQKLGTEQQMILQMQSGTTQFGLITVAGLTNREESFLGWSLPYVFRDVAHASRATGTPAAREMLRRLETHGLVGLGYAFAGMRHVLSLQPVKDPQDLAHKRLRSYPNPLYHDWWTALGAASHALALSDVPPALGLRLLDAVDVDLDILVGLKLHQKAPHLTLTGHMAFPAVIVVSKKFWDTCSEAERATIRKIVADAEAWGFQQSAQADLSNLQKAKADGARVVEADLPGFRKASEGIRAKYTAKNPLIADFQRQATAL